MRERTDEVTIGGHTIPLSRPDKLLFPESGVTKEDVVSYYRKIAPLILPHLKDRPLTLQRFPDGIDENGFYQKEAGDYFPDWITAREIKTESEVKHQVICNDEATLVYLANQACITPHIW